MTLYSPGPPVLSRGFVGSLRPLWIAVLLANGCASASIASDVSRVRSLTNSPVLAHVTDVAVDSSIAADAKELLREPIDVDTAVRIALINNRELRAQLRELGIARGQLMQAGLVANPTFEAETLPSRNTAIELRVEYDIASLVLAPLRARAAAADLDAERHRVAATVVGLGFEVRTAFYALQAAEQRLRATQEAVEAFALGRDAAAALLAAGNIPAIEAARELAMHERARVLAAQLELQVIERRERVHRILGLDDSETSWRVSSTLADVPESLHTQDSVERHAIEASHEIAAMKSRLDAAGRRIGLSRTEGWLPSLIVDVHSLHGDPEAAPGTTPDDAWRFGGGVSLSIPLFDRHQGAIRTHEAVLASLRERYHGVEVELGSTARAAQSRLAFAHAQARQFQMVIVPAQRSVMKEALLQYNAMQIGVFELLQARREQLDVELAHIDSTWEYWSAHAALRALLEGARVDTSPSTTPGSSQLFSAPEGGH